MYTIYIFYHLTDCLPPPLKALDHAPIPGHEELFHGDKVQEEIDNKVEGLFQGKEGEKKVEQTMDAILYENGMGSINGKFSDVSPLEVDPVAINADIKSGEAVDNHGQVEHIHGEPESVLGHGDAFHEEYENFNKVHPPKKNPWSKLEKNNDSDIKVSPWDRLKDQQTSDDSETHHETHNNFDMGQCEIEGDSEKSMDYCLHAEKIRDIAYGVLGLNKNPTELNEEKQGAVDDYYFCRSEVARIQTS